MPFTMKPPRQFALRLQLLIGLGIFLSSWLGMLLGFTMGSEAASLVWAPSGLAVALVLHFGVRTLPAVGLGVLAAHLAVQNPLLFACIGTASNVMEPLVALLLLRRYQPRTPTRSAEVLHFCLFAGLLAPLSSTLFGNAGLYLSGMAPLAAIPASMLVWWLGNALGILIVGPFVLALLTKGYGKRFSSSPRENMLLAGAFVVASLLVFGGLLPEEMSHSLAFLLVPFSVWAAMRLGLLGQTGLVFCVAVVAIAGTWSGQGPFSHVSQLTGLITLGAFLLVMAVTALLVGAGVADRRRVENRLGLGDERLRLLTRNFPNGGVALLDNQMRVLLAGGLGLDQAGLNGANMEGGDFMSFFPDSVTTRLKPAMDDALRGRMATLEAEFKGRIYEVHIQPVLDEGVVSNILVTSHDLTDRVRAEEALAGSYVFLQRTMDSIPHPMFIKTDAGHYRFVNKAFCELFQMTPGAIIGKTVHDIAPSPLAVAYHEKDQELLESGEKDQRYTGQAMTSDGRELQLYFCKSLVNDPVNGETDIIGLAMDISDLHEAQKALEASEAKYRTLFEEMGLAAVVADTQTGEILDVNRQACSLWKCSKEHLLSLRQPDLVPPEYREAAASRFREHIERGGDSSAEVEILTTEGKRVPVEIVSVVLQHQGRPALVGLLKDIRERKKLEQLRQDVEMMSRHDLKSPLNAVIGLPYVLLEAPNLTDEQREIAAIIQESGRRMLQIVNLSLGLYRMETGAYELQSQPVDLLPLLRDIRREFQELLRARSVSLEIVNACIPAMADGPLSGMHGCDDHTQRFLVRGEGLLCYSMLANLIKNAVEASPRGGEVRVTLHCEQEQASLEVHNKGAVPEAIRDRFFNKYVTMGKKDGTGLGAYSARLIAETHGGDIAMQSSEEAGTTVTVRLPAFVY